MSKRKPKPASQILLDLKRDLKNEREWKENAQAERDRAQVLVGQYRDRAKEILVEFGQHGENLSRRWIAGKLAEMLK